MNENNKTIAFIGVALATVAIAFLSQPDDLKEITQDSKKGLPLFEDLNPILASAIQIDEMVTEDEDEIALRKSLSVTSDDKGWFIRRPKFNYPADAKGKVGRVATSLSGLVIHDLESDKQSDHAKFQVLDPNNQDELSKAENKMKEIGKVITISQEKTPLASLIVGSELPNQPALRYVRKPNGNEVYSVKFSNYDEASSRFVDWVEKDFLDLDKFSIKSVTLDNYEIDLNAGEIKRDTPPFVLEYADSEWKLSGAPLSDKEELNKDRLDEMRDSFDDLKIIDVEKKPGILINNLKQGNEFFSDLQDPKNQVVMQAVMGALQQKGFYTVAVMNPAGQKVPKVVSNKGEILVGMKDGVEYVLRFGETYRGPEDDENSTGDSRFIYAFARVNPRLLDPPSLEPVPAPLSAPVQNAPAPDGNQSVSGDSNSTQGEKGDDGKKGDESAPPAIAPPGPPPNFIPPTAPPGAPPPLPQPTVSSAVEANGTSPVDDFAKKKADRDAEIARIQASNAAKQREFQDKMNKAQKRVNELNEKLADWYYVISNEVYEKIRLERKDFVKIKEEEGKAPPEEVKASHILISYKGADRADAEITRSKEEAMAEAQRIRDLIVKDGKDFAEMAKEYSNGPSKSNGGDLGIFKFEVMAKPFSEAAFALDVGAISEVVETGFGFHVIKRTE
jgi:hypothetical protein